jgi:predicted ATPase
VFRQNCGIDAAVRLERSKQQLAAFRAALNGYRRPTGRGQQELARELGLHPAVLSHKLNGNDGAALRHDEVRGIVRTLAAWHALETRAQVIELLELMGLGSNQFSAAEWAAPPLVELDASLEHASPRGPRQHTRADSTAKGRLPVDLMPLVGRVDQVEQIVDLLGGAAHLVTLTGPGGVGKTRLAIAAAAVLTERSGRPVCLAELAAVRDPELVGGAIASALGLRQSVTGERGIDAGLLEYLHNRQLLLVLDNLEQVLSSATLIAELLQAAPDVRVLATSRAPLRIYGEYEVRVSPLRLASPGAPAPEVLASDAVALFVQRARAARADFEPGLDQAELLDAICRRLDGLPLAIELAAARVRHLSLGSLLERLTRSLEILDHGPRNAPDRHRTLRATLDWSYQLLPPDQQRLFMQLGVFLGGCTLDAVASVCGDTAGEDLESCLWDLVDNALLEVVAATPDAASQPRFHMLETVREYALARLAESGETSVTLHRHTTYFTNLAERVPADLVGSHAAEWYAQFELEIGNFRSALDQALERGAPEQPELRLATALARFWLTRGRFDEARAVLETLIGRARAAPSAAGVRAITLLGHAEALRGELSRARQFGAEALAQAEQLGDLDWIAYAQRYLGASLFVSGIEGAASMLEAAVVNAKRHGDTGQLASALMLLGMLRAPDDPDAARERLGHALRLSRQVGDVPTASLALAYLAMLALHAGHEAEAAALADEAGRTADVFSYPDALGIAWIVQGGLARIHGKSDVARSLYASSLRLFWEEGHAGCACSTLEEIAGLEAEGGDAQLAARLLGAVDAFCAPRGLVLARVWRMWWSAEPAALRARARAGDPKLAGAWEAGQTLRLDQAVALIG